MILPLFRSASFHQSGKAFLPIIHSLESKCRFLLTTTALVISPSTALAQSVSAESSVESGIALSSDEKLSRANQLSAQASKLRFGGNSREAVPLFLEASKLKREILGEKHPDTIDSLLLYALVLKDMGRINESEPHFANVLQLRREVLGEKHPETLRSLNTYAHILRELGRASEAKPLDAEVLRLHQEVLAETNPGKLIETMGAHAARLTAHEAEPILAEALQLSRERLGEKHFYTMRSLSRYADVLQKLDRVGEAEPFYSQALRLSREVLDNKNPGRLGYLTKYAMVLERLKRTSEAQPIWAEAQIRAQDLLDLKRTFALRPVMNYTLLLRLRGYAAEAEPLIAEVLNLHRLLLGEKHTDTLSSLSQLASVRMALPSRSHLAVAPARSLVNNVRAAREGAGFTPSEEAQLGREEKSQSGQFQLFANAAWSYGPGLSAEARAAGAKPLDDGQQAALREEVLTALQDSLTGAAGKAISATVARKAAGPLEPLAIEREELSLQWVEADKALIKILAKRGGASEENRNRLRTRIAGLEARMKSIDERLKREAPEYFALIRPEALSLAKAQKVLASDEAALMIVPTANGTHVMLVSDEGTRWARSDWAFKRIDASVKRLLWDVGADVDVGAAESANWAEKGTGAYPFAFDSSYDLYRELIAPIADGLKGKRHVFVSASGSLSSLPFGLLVSEVPVGNNGDPDVLRSAQWFADAHALIQIPSLQSLEFLRKYRPSDGNISNLPFLGIGDPVLTGRSETRGSSRSGRGVASGNGGFKRLFNEKPTRSGAGIANVSELRKMARLPGTAIELKAMWEEFGKPADALHLAEFATEDFIRSQNLDANIIVFATHGLLAGEIGGTAEPGLVLTPPLEASEKNDGYLSASEISALKLNADWVILSACNTAAGDGSEGAPGLSGLARSFFYAGARNLLASHWPVRDDVAAKLTVRTIAIAKQNPHLSRAEAFQQAMREIREDKNADSADDTWAHPSAWAPFSLIGDGAN